MSSQRESAVLCYGTAVLRYCEYYGDPSPGGGAAVTLACSHQGCERGPLIISTGYDRQATYTVALTRLASRWSCSAASRSAALATAERYGAPFSRVRLSAFISSCGSATASAE